ncbi:hypothetical protein LOK74_12980 [Brevibacillus humidisoli]|uniref:hypothetical protein n=1 Tax=Brevibacillus humidisoli TaxID=2895522 RepID=UPI001E38A689|nr:hypothetical protein [Brevibacillus humidisoli]UFJ38995.1 hypothetical protein LOK74_12980 [Brevibacillus humidisoli]
MTKPTGKDAGWKYTLVNLGISIAVGLGTGYLSGQIVTKKAEERAEQQRLSDEKRQREEKIVSLFREGERWFKFEKYEEAVNAYEQVAIQLDKLILTDDSHNLNLINHDELMDIYMTMLPHLKESYGFLSKKVRDTKKKRQLLQDMLLTYERMGNFEKKNPLWFITKHGDDEEDFEYTYLNSMEEIGNIALEILKTYKDKRLHAQDRAYVEKIFSLGMRNYQHLVRTMDQVSVVGPEQEYYVKQLHQKIEELGTLRELLLLNSP